MKSTKKTVTVTTTTETDAPKKTYLAIVLDESGSMEQFKADTIGGFNTAIDEIKQLADLGGQTYVSLVTFGGNVRVPLMLASADSLSRLDDTQYRPAGGTPMLDAIGTVLDSLARYDTTEENVSFKVTILTDGEENASHEYTGWQIADTIKRLEATGRWNVEIIGANLDLDKLRAMTGIQQTYSYDASSHLGNQRLWSSYNAGTQSYFATRSAGGTLNNSFAQASAANAGSLDLSSAEMLTMLQTQAQTELQAVRDEKKTSVKQKLDNQSTVVIQ